MNNLIHQDIFLNGKKYEPNTFIQGIGASDHTPDAATFASKVIGLNVSDIKVYKVDADNNVSCHINGEYEIKGFSTYEGEASNGRYWIDLDGKVTDIGGRSISGYNQKLLLPKATEWGTQSTRNGSVDFAYCPEIINGSFYPFHNWLHGVNRLYIPKLTNLDKLYSFYNFNLSGKSRKCVIYINPIMLDYEGNGVHPRIAYIINQGADVRYVTDFTPPLNITDLSVSDITETSANLNFTPPYSLNNLDFYEVWIDDGSNNPEQLYLPSNEITASGQTIRNLIPGTTYKLKLAACDIYYNGSGMSDIPAFSNEIEFTTLNITLKTNLISYYKLENNVLDSFGSNHGTAINVSYETGLVGQRGVFNGTSSYVNLGNPANLNITGDMSIVALVNIPDYNPSESGSAIITWANGTWTTYPFHLLILPNGLLRFNNQTIAVDSVTTIPLNQNVVLTVTRGDNIGKVYINGVLDNTVTIPPTITSGDSGMCSISRSNNQRFKGKLDEVAIYNRALTSEEVSQINTILQSGESLI